MKLRIMLLVSLIACGSDTDDSAKVVEVPEEESIECPDFDSFETRLRSNLLIAGERCEDCQQDQWLVTIDNQNTCTSDGICTKIFVSPVISDLTESSVSLPPDLGCTYDMNPLGPLSSEQLEEMKKHEVRVLEGENPEVFLKE